MITKVQHIVPGETLPRAGQSPPNRRRRSGPEVSSSRQVQVSPSHEEVRVSPSQLVD